MRELISFLGAVIELKNFVTMPDLANICAPSRSMSDTDAEWEWTGEHEEAFRNFNREGKSKPEFTHFKGDY